MTGHHRQAGFSFKLRRKVRSLWLFRSFHAAWLKFLKRRPAAVRSVAARVKALEKTTSTQDIGYYVINLDESVERLDRISFLASPRILRRIAGVPGRYLADGLMKRFGAQVNASFKGTLGCFLSHYAAWEAHTVAAEPFALILEDDCVPLVKLPRSAASLGLPDDFDICFLTTALGPISEGKAQPVHRSLFRPLAESMAELASHLVAPGAYGYVLSKRGAIQLIARADEDGFYGDVDWRMVSYCLPREAVATYPVESFACGALKAHFSATAHRPPLSGYAAQPGLVRPGRIGSVRERDNERRHAHMWLETRDG